MKINTAYDASLSAGQTVAAQSNSGPSFQSAFAKAKDSVGTNANTDTAADSPPATDKVAAADEAAAAALKELLAYLKKSPAELMRESILKQMGLTEAELKTMPPEKQMAIEATIAAKIKEMMQNPAASNAGGTAGPAPSGASMTATGMSLL